MGSLYAPNPPMRTAKPQSRPTFRPKSRPFFSGAPHAGNRSHFPINFGGFQIGNIALIHSTIKHKQHPQAKLLGAVASKVFSSPSVKGVISFVGILMDKSLLSKLRGR